MKCPKHHTFLQVDLGVPKTVRGVITQGARSGDAASGATTDNRAFVRKYKVAHSVNAKDWNFIMDSKTSLPKVGERDVVYVLANDTPNNHCTFLVCFRAAFRGEHTL